MVKNFSWKSYGIGVDIGGTKVLIIIADDNGNIVLKERTKTPPDIDEITDTIDNCIKKAGISKEKIVGMGVGIPGRVNCKNGVVLDVPSLKWRNLDLKKIFSKNFRFPVVIMNDVNLAVIGERWFGGKNSDNIFYIAIGTGVGSAIIANGEIIEGSDFSAGEIGYFIDKEDVCEGRGNNILDFGTFEKRTSGTALAEKGLIYGYSPQELFQQYELNNPKVVPIIKGFVLEISIAIANVVSLINPDIVVIGGGVADSLDCVIAEIKRKVANLTPISTKIELSTLGGEAGAFGGIAWVFEEDKKFKNWRVKNERN